MRIWIFSDIHLPHIRIPIEAILPAVPQADVCVCAGDLVEGDPAGGVRWLEDYVRPSMPIIYVLGNHEFYNAGGMGEARAKAQKAGSEAGIHVLDDTAIDMGGIRFLGSTLWSDFSILSHGNLAERDRSMKESGKWVNDFHLIRTDENEIWTPRMAMLQHHQSRLWLTDELARSDLPTIIVSHHAPHPLSIAQEFAHDRTTGAFVSDLGELILGYQPALWLHGHTHTRFDYHVGGSRVVCNPRGYRHEKTNFDPSLVLEIGN